MTPKQWKRLFARIVLFALCTLAVTLLVTVSFATWGLFIKERLVQKEHFNEAESLRTLEEQKVTLKENLQKLSTERGIEEEVRRRFPVAKPGEVEIMLVPASQESAPRSDPKRSFLQTIFGWFSH